MKSFDSIAETNFRIEDYSEVESIGSESDHCSSDEKVATVETLELANSHLSKISASTAEKIQNHQIDHLIKKKPYPLPSKIFITM